MLKVVLKQVSIKVPDDFKAKVRFGSNVSVGTILGTGTKYRILESHVIKGKNSLNVDDGVFVQKGEKLIGLIRSRHDGLVKIKDNLLQVVEVLPNEPIYSELMGKVLLVSSDEIILETKFIVIPMFVSRGFYVKTELAILDLDSVVASFKELDDRVSNRVVVVPGALTYKLYKSALSFGATGVIAASIDWLEYAKLLEEFKKDFNFGILQGFGTLEIWDFYKYIFSNLSSLYAQVDFKDSLIYLPFYDIMFLERSLISFKLGYWGRKIKEIENLGDSYFVKINKQTKAPISHDEIQQLIL